MSKKINLTPVELELMEIVWKLGQGTVREVMAELPANRDLAYTSVSTILRILEQKEILATEKIGKQHIYSPLVSKESFAIHSVEKIVNQAFSGRAVELVAYLVEKGELSLEEIAAIQKRLNAKKRELSE